MEAVIKAYAIATTFGERRKIITPQQLAILAWIANGKRNDQIAQIMNLTQSVVQAEVARAMDVTGTGTRAGLIAYVIRQGIIK